MIRYIAFGNAKNATNSTNPEDITFEFQHGPGGARKCSERCPSCPAPRSTLVALPMLVTVLLPRLPLPNDPWPDIAEEGYYNRWINCAQDLYPDQDEW